MIDLYMKKNLQIDVKGSCTPHHLRTFANHDLITSHLQKVQEWKCIQINVCVPHIICYQTIAQLLYVTWYWSLRLLFNYTSNPPLLFLREATSWFFPAVGGWGFKCIDGLANVIHVSIIILLTCTKIGLRNISRVLVVLFFFIFIHTV